MVRTGVIGPGAIAKNLHLPSLDAHPEAQVVALCGRNQENASAVAEKFSIPRVYADYREMLKKERLDAVLVLTPDHNHYAMTMDALEAGGKALPDRGRACSNRNNTVLLRAHFAGEDRKSGRGNGKGARSRGVLWRSR